MYLLSSCISGFNWALVKRSFQATLHRLIVTLYILALNDRAISSKVCWSAFKVCQSILVLVKIIKNFLDISEHVTYHVQNGHIPSWTVILLYHLKHWLYAQVLVISLYYFSFYKLINRFAFINLHLKYTTPKCWAWHKRTLKHKMD